MTTHRSRRASAPIVVALLAIALGHAGAAQAAFAGRNDRIAFSSYRDDQVDIFTMHPKGGGVRNLTNDGHPDFQPAWSPEGGRIVFVSLHVGTSHFDQLFAMDAKGGQAIRVTHVPHGNVQEPAWSPDGQRIAFHVSFGGAIDDDLFIVDRDGSDLVRITDNDRNDSDPAWSPDGARLAFVRDAKVMTMEPDGEMVRNVTPDGMLGFDPAWSPDGRRIAFIGRTLAARQYDLFTIRPDGSGLRRLSETGRTETDPAWSPVGRRIVYVLTRYRDENDIEEDLICTIRADGTRRRVLSTDASSRDGFPDWRSVGSHPRID